MGRILNIACLQTRPRADFESALAEALALAEEAVGAGGQLLTLPEYCGGLETDGFKLKPPAKPEDKHPVLGGLRQFAKERKVWMVIGSLAITGPGGKTFNRGFVIDDAGNIRNRYDKIHLFDVRLSETEVYRESELVSSGDEAVLAETPLAILGYSICYDLRFPGLYRDLARGGAEILLVPAAFTKKTGEAHWHILNRARAIENGAFVVAPCSVGPVSGGGECYGHSLIINPWGEIIVDGGGTNSGVVQAVVDLEEVIIARTKIPSLSHDKKFFLKDKIKVEVA
jgi:predicted amidohydrolase